MMTRTLALAFLLFSLAACAGITPRSPPISDQLDALKAKLFDYMVLERQKMNAEAKPLRLDSELSAAAQAHSEAMARERSFGERGAGNNVAVQQLMANPEFQGFVAEFSAMQYFTPEAGIDADAYARAILDQWLQSPPHRRNIGHAAFDRTGIGVAVNGNELYAAEVFATDLGLAAPK